MIEIINTSKGLGDRDLSAYVVAINGTEIVQFKHRQSDGLAACLTAAARAVEEKKKPDAR